MTPDPHPSIAGRGPAAHQHPSREADQRLELAIATLLRVGVVLAAVLVALGGVLVMRHPGAPVPSYTRFHPPGSLPPGAHALTSITGVFRHLADPSGASIIELGLLVLIATPIARVALSGYVFLRNRDWLYAAVSVLVLSLLLFGLVTGK